MRADVLRVLVPVPKAYEEHDIRPRIEELVAEQIREAGATQVGELSLTCFTEGYITNRDDSARFNLEEQDCICWQGLVNVLLPD